MFPQLMEPILVKGSYANDAVAISIIKGIYPNKTVTGIDVRNIYEYGGMIHCIPQQQPA